MERIAMWEKELQEAIESQKEIESKKKDREEKREDYNSNEA